MKLKTLLVVFTSCFIFSACLDEHEELIPRVDELGLTKEIHDLVPDAILDTIINLGMPINGGEFPPAVEGTFLASPFILISSNVNGDNPNKLFADYKVSFYQQDDDKLNVMVDYENSIESGKGIGSYIVGRDDKFSVFVRVFSKEANFGSTAKLVHIISGEMQETGIKNLYFSNFMIDNEGNPNGVWINNGEGRVIYDQDGFSEKI